MKIYKKLFEGISKIVYHKTNNFENIAKTDKLFGSFYDEFQNSDFSEKKVGDETYYISTARSILSSYIWEGWVLELDGEKLSRHHRAVPYDYFRMTQSDKNTEFEDRIVFDKPFIDNIHKYIRKVYFISKIKDLSPIQAKNALSTLEDYKEKYGVPFAFVNSASSYRKEIPIETIKAIADKYYGSASEDQDLAINKKMAPWNIERTTKLKNLQNLEFLPILNILNYLIMGWYNLKTLDSRNIHYDWTWNNASDDIIKIFFFKPDANDLNDLRRKYPVLGYWLNQAMIKRYGKILSLGELSQIIERETKTNKPPIRDEEIDVEHLFALAPNYVTEWRENLEKEIEYWGSL